MKEVTYKKITDNDGKFMVKRKTYRKGIRS